MGRFVLGSSGNLAGRPKGSLSITDQIKQKLQEFPEGRNTTYLDFLIKRILHKAVSEGDPRMIKQIWEQIDGRPRERMRLEGDQQKIFIITRGEDIEESALSSAE